MDHFVKEGRRSGGRNQAGKTFQDVRACRGAGDQTLLLRHDVVERKHKTSRETAPILARITHSACDRGR
ncbi:MAG: hypothetical protein N2C14_19470, partial [Planctomycetales bacterium]